MSLTQTSRARSCVRGLSKTVTLIVVLLVWPSPIHPQYPSYAQYLGQCSTDPRRSIQDLEWSIQSYHEHIDRLGQKFVTGFYRQGERKGRLRYIDLKRVVERLEALAPRRTALLFYAFAMERPSGVQRERLCLWLISPHIDIDREASGIERRFVQETVDIRLQDLASLRTNIVKSLGVIALVRDLMPRWNLETIDAGIAGPLDRARAFEQARRTLLPDSFVSALEKYRIDTLVVLPIFDIGAIPFGALPLHGQQVVMDMVSVVIAPGFFVFLDEPRRARTTFPNALIVANPDGSQTDRVSAAALPHLRDEADAIAARFGTKALISDARLNVVESRIRSKPGPSFIYIAAHGRADEENPLDGSFLLLRDRAWTAKNIAKVPIGESHPLVVLSACQTGLGKNFEVGNIGLARAWHQAGASNVVMSLWSVYQPSTRDLLRSFIGLLSACPPDKALRAAMRQARDRFEPAQWAGFAVFGLPERPATPAWNDPRCGVTGGTSGGADNVLQSTMPSATDQQETDARR